MSDESKWMQFDDRTVCIMDKDLYIAIEENVTALRARIAELEAQLAEATEANTSCTRYIADQEIRIANLEHLLGDEDDDEDKPYYDTPGGF